MIIWRKSIHFLQRYAQKNDFYIFRSPWPWCLTFGPQIKFASLVILVQRNVSRKLEVFTAFRENQEAQDGRVDGQTDGVQRLMRIPGRNA